MVPDNDQCLDYSPHHRLIIAIFHQNTAQQGLNTNSKQIIIITSNQNDRRPAENLLFLILLVNFYKNPQSVVQPEPISKANKQYSQAKVNNKHTSVLFSTAYCSTTFTTSSQRSHCTELATCFTGT